LHLSCSGVGLSVERLRSPPRLVTAICAGRRFVRLRNPRQDGRELDGQALSLEVVESREDLRTRVRLRGELDVATGGAVTKRLAVLRERGESVVLDLDELTFIDVSGVRLVLAAAEASRRDGWTFAVTHGSRPVRRVFQLLELDTQLPYDEATR
jgi:anti-anti-sigma factor